MKNIVVFSLTVLLAILTVKCSKDNSEPPQTLETAVKSDHDKHAAAVGENRPDKLELPENLLNVLTQEMQQIESGMQLLLDYLARGEADKAENIAMKIHNSFILKQSLSPQELQQLISLLPTGFVQMDRAFHGQAKELAQTVQRQDFAAGIKIYGEMTQACVSCHQQYAQEKFPGLATEQPEVIKQ